MKLGALVHVHMWLCVDVHACMHACLGNVEKGIHAVPARKVSTMRGGVNVSVRSSGLANRISGMLAAQPRAVLVAMGTGESLFMFNCNVLGM